MNRFRIIVWCQVWFAGVACCKLDCEGGIRKYFELWGDEVPCTGVVHGTVDEEDYWLHVRDVLFSRPGLRINS